MRPPGRGGTWEQALRPGTRAGGPCPGSSKEGAWSPSPSAAEVGSRPAVACVPSGGRRPWAGVAPSVPRPLRLAQLEPQPPQRLLEGAGFSLPTGLLATTIAPAPSLPPRGSRPGGARPPPRRKNRSWRGPSLRSPAVPKPRLLLSSEPWDEELSETEDASGSRRGGRLGLQLGGRGAEVQSWGGGLGARGACQTVSSSLMSQICVEKGRCSVSAHPRGRLRAVRPQLPVSTEAPPCFSREETETQSREARHPGAAGVWPGSAVPILPAFPRWPSLLAPLPLGPLSVNPGERRPRPAWGARGLPAPCWGWRGLVPDLSPTDFPNS